MRGPTWRPRPVWQPSIQLCARSWNQSATANELGNITPANNRVHLSTLRDRLRTLRNPTHSKVIP